MNQSTIRKVMAELGRRGGKSTSKAKIEAARKNAKKGGRPKGSTKISTS